MPTSDADRYAQLLQNLAVRIGAIRDAIERAFGMTLPTVATLNAEFEIITNAIYTAADQPRPVPLTDNKPTTRTTLSIGSTSGLMMARTSLSTSQAWRTSLSRGAAYRAACERWPNARITLRQGARVVEDSQCRIKA